MVFLLGNLMIISYCLVYLAGWKLCWKAELSILLHVHSFVSISGRIHILIFSHAFNTM